MKKSYIFLLLSFLLLMFYTKSSLSAVSEASSGFQMPIDGQYTFGYEYLDGPIDYGCSDGAVYHPGVDLNVYGTSCDGDRGTDVHAVADGIVRDIGTASDEWGTIVIEHNYKGMTVYSQYGHLDSILVNEGNTVTKNQHIGEMGDNETDCVHLHFEIRNSNHPNPTYAPAFCFILGGELETTVSSWYEDPINFINTHPAYNLQNLQVNVMPSGVASPVNSWDSYPYTWPGNNLELWGNVKYDGTGTLTYTWDFGDGSPVATGSVTNRNNIAVNHAYSAGSWIATLTVTDGMVSDSDTVYIDVVPQSFEVKTNLAIQRALKYLYMTRQAWSVNDCSTYIWSGNRWEGSTGLAVLAFEDHGHREMNDHDKDIYAETVEKGLDAIFAMLRGTSASNIVNADSDINGNGRKVYEGYTGGNNYENGILAMAIAGTATPNAIVRSCGDAEVRGKPYKTVLEDMVDYIAYGQNDTYSWREGGWRYGANYGESDNSVSQWPALGLAAAQDNFSINAPSWVKTRLQNWLNYSQCSNGGFGYTSPNNWCNIAKTGAGIIEMNYAGGGGNQANAINFIATNWGSTSYDYGNIGDHYAMYAVKKGLQKAGYSTVGGHDWQNEYNTWYVNNQVNAGTNGVYWPGSVRISAGQSSAMFGLLVMAPGVVELPPVADAGIDQEVSPGVTVKFDGTDSHHTDPARHIVKYEWDFDYDGSNFNVDATGANATKSAGYQITNGTDTQNYTVALRVTDDNSPAKTAMDTANVRVSNGNVAPVSVPGGPYLGAVGEDITLNGSGSYDINSKNGANPICGLATPSGCDEIVKYEWDTDGDGAFDDAVGPTPTVNFGPTFIGTKTIGLKVTDSFGRSTAQSTQLTTVAVSDLYPITYVKTYQYYNRSTGKWTVAWKVNIGNKGNGTAKLVSAKWTGSSIPAGVTVIDDSVAWSGTIDPGEIQLSDDEFRYTYSRTGPDLSKIMWDIEFTDELGTRHVIRNVPQ
jgi:murein DD-endopeptidase MepM/ murein hydrolase activator NlpD